MMMAARKYFLITLYRYGFNGIEINSEFSNDSGTDYTTLYRPLNVRLGRWFSIDPEFKSTPYNSTFLSFSNNPLINVDPLGNTDFYNTRGELIGSDGVDNNLNFLVLKNSTERQIKREVRKNGTIEITAKQEKNMIPVPNDEVLNKLDETLNSTQSSGNTEYGFVNGVTNTGEQSASSVYSGTSGTATEVPKFDATKSVRELVKKGVTPTSVIHSHPNVIKYNDKTGEYKTSSSSGPSSSDFLTAQSSRYADMLVELRAEDPNSPPSVDKNNAIKNPNTWVKRSDTKSIMLVLYNQNSTLRTFDFNKFKELVKKINSAKAPAVHIP